MAVQQIDRFDVKNKAKHGWTPERFCEFYQCTEAEFERRVNQLFRREAPSVLQSIHANIAKRNRLHGSSRSSHKLTNQAPVIPPPRERTRSWRIRRSAWQSRDEQLRRAA